MSLSITLTLLVLAVVTLGSSTGAHAAEPKVLVLASDNDNAVHTVKGFLSLQDTGRAFGDQCRGTGGYIDLGPGAPVVIRDGAGRVIGIGEFGVGKGSGERKAIGYGAHAACVFTFVVKNVPDTELYSFQVGRRSALAYTHDELEDSNWRVGSVVAG